MLRLQREASTQIISNLYYPHYSESADPLHCVGEELPIAVRTSNIMSSRWANHLDRELYGTSEETEELDETENAENGDLSLNRQHFVQIADTLLAEEIENLQREAQALKEIRSSMGSDDFSRKVFEKVFKTDIERLRQIEDMWKERQPPELLDFDKLQEESASIAPTVSVDDQKVWTLAENFTVFKDRWAISHLSRGHNGSG